MKQTAVEWLIDKVEEHFCLLPVDLIEQAKAMHKEEIMDAWYNGFEEIRPYVDNSEQYYKETFKQD